MNSLQISLLEKGLEALQLDTPSEPLIKYLQLLEKWNKTYNLTAIRDFNEMVSRHLLDSLALSPWVQGNSLLDVGTGPGLPGIPIALTHPNLKITLLDSNGKKVSFLKEVKRQLGIQNIEIVQTRAEKFKPAHTFDIITSRAFSDLAQFIQWTKHLISPQGTWLAMKGQIPIEELKKIELPYEIKSYQVPYLEGNRCCIIIQSPEQKFPLIK